MEDPVQWHIPTKPKSNTYHFWRSFVYILLCAIWSSLRSFSDQLLILILEIHCDDYVTSSVDICCQQPLNSDHKKKSKHISDCVESNKDQEFQSLLLKSLSSPPLLTQPPSQSLSSSTSLIQCFGSCQSSLSAPLKSSSEIVTMLSSLNCSNRIEPLEGCKKNKIWSIDDLISSGNSKADLESEHEAEFRRSSNSSDNM